MTKNEFKLLYSIQKDGLASYRTLSARTGLSVGFISGVMRSFIETGRVNDAGITELGLEALSPYRVRSAIIMAAGMSSRFVPLSLEKPKGLLTVKNEVLIERQIRQLRQAGIEEIVLVLGYKKEMFFYLEDKYNVKLVINPLYNVKNNIESLLCAQRYIGHSYICSSDDYFSENVFEEYVYQSYYAAIHVTGKTNEWYMLPDNKGNIGGIRKSGQDGYIMLGHVFWDSAFSEAFIRLMNEHRTLGDYDACLWEDLLADNLRALPPMAIREYPSDVIHEFDSLDEIRQFDDYYIHNSHSRIMHNICNILHCAESDIENFRPIKEGLTNTSFIFGVGAQRYVYRHPGEGTDKIISREHEKIALEKARALGVDPTFIAMDEREGWKISHYVPGIRIPDYSDPADSSRVIAVMRRLHDRKECVDWQFSPWEAACEIETLLAEQGGIHFSGFDTLKQNVRACYEATLGDGVEKCFCHCDTYAPNWMLTETETILIDWEYAGHADPGCDVGGYIMDAMYDIGQAESFIREYCGKDCPDALLFHYLAYVAIISYYWFVWALYREACGAVMGESLHKWYVMAKRFSHHLTQKGD